MATETKGRNPATPLRSAVLAGCGSSSLIGLMGTSLVSIGALLPGSPFALKLAGAWFFGTPSFGQNLGTAHASGFMLFAALTCEFSGIALLLRAWLTIIRRVGRDPEGHIGRLPHIFVLWSTPLLIAPPMFSDDIYSYAAQGEMVSHHISPYLYGPGVMGATPFASLAQGVWVNAPSPYGPLFSGLEGGIVRFADHRVLESILLFRLLSVVGVALIAGFLPSLARSYGKDPGVAFSLAVLNPLVLLFLVGSGHNDALMIGLLVAGLSMARRGHANWGMTVCALAGAVKVPGAIGAFAIAWTSVSAASPRRRSFALVKAAVISAATLEALSVLFGVGWGWTGSLGRSGTVTTWITPIDLIAKIPPDAGISASTFLHVAHVAGPAIALAICFWTLKRLPVLGLPRALGLSYLALVLLGPVVQPWYLLWGIVILATTAGPHTARAIALLSATASVLGVIGLGQLFGELHSVGSLYLALLILIMAATVVSPMSSLSQRVRPIGDRRRTGSLADDIEEAMVRL